MNNINDEVLNLILNSKEPLSRTEISEQLNMSQASVYNSIKRLLNDNKIIEIAGKNKKFYLSDKDLTCVEFDNMNQTLMEKTVYAKENYEELDEKFSNIDSKINNLYANIITLMGIFVAIFSLISTNAKVVFDLNQTTINVKDITISVLVMNAATVISIIVLLMGVYFLTKDKKRD